jgi:hypothetical protein
MSMPGFTAEASFFQAGGHYWLAVGGADDRARRAITPQAIHSGCWEVMKWIDTDWGSFPVCIRHCIIPIDQMGHFKHYVGVC